MDYVKNVINPIKQVAPRDSIRGFVDDYYHHTEDVLLLRGEIHYERKPVSHSLFFLECVLPDFIFRLACDSHPHRQGTPLQDLFYSKYVTRTAS